VADDVIEADARVGESDALMHAVAAVQAFAPRAEDLERDGISRSDVGQLAAAGVLSAGLTGDWSPAQIRELHEQLAGTSGALWFVLTQHRSPAETARTTSNGSLQARYSSRLASGSMLGAVSFAHLRRPGPPAVSAVRDGSGWRLSGRLDWVTSWGLADVLLLMAETSDGEVVQALLPASEREGLLITGELSLAAMQGTSTVGATLQEVWVDDTEVANIVPKGEWLSRDAQRVANTPPAVFGLTRTALNALTESADRRGWMTARELASKWREEFVLLRADAYGLVDDVAPGDRLDERVALRARATKLAQDVTSVLVAVQAGRAMLTSSPEQRWAREALFALVQAQTQVTREALVAAFSTE
jgi:alkylation response protein AidB-like acyl-CoA dehydrogenase